MASPVLKITEDSVYDLTQRLEELKRDAAHVTALIVSKLGEESQAYIRSEQLEAAIQRLEWALERKPYPAASS